VPEQVRRQAEPANSRELKGLPVLSSSFAD